MVAVTIVLVLVEVIILVFVGYEILKQRVKLISDREELFELLKGIYEFKLRNKAKIFVFGGEANKEVYEKLYPLIYEKLKGGEIREVSFVVGPEISIYREDEERIEKGNVKLAEIHPIFKLKQEFPEAVRVYIKRDNSLANVNHFVTVEDEEGNTTLVYVEALHRPLQESRAVLIEKPNFLVSRKYRKLRSEILKLVTEGKIKEVGSVEEKVNKGYWIPFKNFHGGKLYAA